MRKILEEHLLAQNLSTIIDMSNSGLDPMLDLDKIEDLNRLYRLFGMVPGGLPSLRRGLKNSIIRRGKEVNQASMCTEGGEEVEIEADKTEAKTAKGKAKARTGGMPPQTLTSALKWVQDVLDLKDKFDKGWKEAFDSNRDIESSINEVMNGVFIFLRDSWKLSGFRRFYQFERKGTRVHFVVHRRKLEEGPQGGASAKALHRSVLVFMVPQQKSEMEVDIILEKTITVFRYLTEKDAFERYYKNHLAKRLLLGRSVSDDAERGMLAKLKVECGYQFTQKLEGMFQDMKVSSDTMQAYRRHLQNTTVRLALPLSKRSLYLARHRKLKYSSP